MEGAGGVGGLLATWHQGSVYYPCLDGNGNVGGHYAASGPQAGKLVARYDYDAFGNRITNTGPEVELCPFGFSTKYRDEETGMLYYGYRYYSPEMGRWISRDPIGEEGGVNLYGFVNNNPANLIDSLGNAPMGWPVLPPPGYPPSILPGGYGDGPGEGFIVVVAFVTIFTPIPGDEVAVGSMIGGWVVKQVISKGGQVVAQGSKCCRAVKVVVEKMVKKVKGRNPKDYTEETRDALSDAFKGGYHPSKLNNVSTAELQNALDKLKDGLDKLKGNPRNPEKQICDFEKRIELVNDVLNNR
jgi:RHS repeat-associated protein